MEPGSSSSDQEPLRSENQSLRQELKWTKEQHVRWWQERDELVADMRELRRRVDAYEQSGITREEHEELGKMKAWADELQSAVYWYQQQLANWQTECAAAKDWSAQLDSANRWLKERLNNCEAAQAEKDSLLAENHKLRAQLQSVEAEAGSFLKWRRRFSK